MKQYLLPKKGNFYKANLHIHTNLSDGKATPEEVKKIYMEHGYSIIAFTDHEVIIPHNDMSDENFLAITSYELAVNEKKGLPFHSTKTVHINFYAKDKNTTVPPFFDESKVWLKQTLPYVTNEMRANKYDFVYSTQCINDIVAKAKGAGFIASFNHPNWSLQNLKDYIDYKGFWAVECYNHECAESGYEDTTVPLDDLLHTGERIFPIATDDAHKVESFCGGFVMVKADKLEYCTVMDALEKGEFYSSNGPQIKELTIENGILHIECSEAANIIVNTEMRLARNLRPGEDGKLLTCANIDMNQWINNIHELPEDSKNKAYFRITIVDKSGKRAWSRPYFADELK